MLKRRLLLIPLAMQDSKLLYVLALLLCVEIVATFYGIALQTFLESLTNCVYRDDSSAPIFYYNLYTVIYTSIF